MTTLAELEALVINITKRPDKSIDIRQAIRMQTLKLHRANFFVSDLRRLSVALGANSDYKYTYDLGGLARYRYVSAVVDYLSGGVQSIDFERLDANNIFADYALERQNYFYILGRDLVIRSCRELSSVQLDYYEYPDVADATYSSWIADRYPDIVADAASSEIFKVIGKADEAAKYRQFSVMAVHDILKDEIS